MRMHDTVYFTSTISTSQWNTTVCCIYFIMFVRQVNHLKVSESLNFKRIISIESVFCILAYFSLFFIFLEQVNRMSILTFYNTSKVRVHDLHKNSNWMKQILFVCSI